MEQANKWSISIYHKNIDLRNANDVKLHISPENAKWERGREKECVKRQYNRKNGFKSLS